MSIHQMNEMKEAYGLGRSRHGGKGAISGLHLNPYTMCIHTLVGGGWPTMQVLVVEIYESDPVHELNRIEKH